LAIAGSEFTAVHCNHFFPDQPQFITDHTEFVECLLYRLFIVLYEIRYGFESGFNPFIAI